MESLSRVVFELIFPFIHSIFILLANKHLGLLKP